LPRCCSKTTIRRPLKDDDKEAALAARPGPLAPAARSPKALKKIAHERTEERWPAHSFETLLADLGTICVNTIEPTDRSIPPFKKVTLRLAHRELRANAPR